MFELLANKIGSQPIDVDCPTMRDASEFAKLQRAQGFTVMILPPNHAGESGASIGRAQELEFARVAS